MRKPRKDYRLEEKWEENDVKVLTLRTPGLTELKPLLDEAAMRQKKNQK